jgi:hypothetical protein
VVSLDDGRYFSNSLGIACPLKIGQGHPNCHQRPGLVRMELVSNKGDFTE